MTIRSIGIIDRLKDRGNEILFHWLAENFEEGNKIRKKALDADVYMSSTNALTMDGKLVKTGTAELMKRIDDEGFGFLRNELEQNG